MYIMPDPAGHFQAPYMTNMKDNKCHLIKCVLGLFFKASIDLQSVTDPGRAFHSLAAEILKA